MIWNIGKKTIEQNSNGNLSKENFGFDFGLDGDEKTNSIVGYNMLSLMNKKK